MARPIAPLAIAEGGMEIGLQRDARTKQDRSESLAAREGAAV